MHTSERKRQHGGPHSNHHLRSFPAVAAAAEQETIRHRCYPTDSPAVSNLEHNGLRPQDSPASLGSPYIPVPSGLDRSTAMSFTVYVVLLEHLFFWRPRILGTWSIAITR
mmetsp:Transcript_35756/g.101190  ORF Transcript_35756/g.101190 Transcript_35756/m.101190 type:complete len:110 (+) Transcript_35756:248-577(+)